MSFISRIAANIEQVRINIQPDRVILREAPVKQVKPLGGNPSRALVLHVR